MNQIRHANRRTSWDKGRHGPTSVIMAEANLRPAPTLECTIWRASGSKYIYLPLGLCILANTSTRGPTHLHLDRWHSCPNRPICTPPPALADYGAHWGKQRKTARWAGQHRGMCSSWPVLTIVQGKGLHSPTRCRVITVTLGRLQGEGHHRPTPIFQGRGHHLPAPLPHNAETILGQRTQGKVLAKAIIGQHLLVIFPYAIQARGLSRSSRPGHHGYPGHCHQPSRLIVVIFISPQAKMLLQIGLLRGMPGNIKRFQSVHAGTHGLSL